MEMPGVVTHRYDPARGACLNVCALGDLEAARVLERLRRESRPTWKADYLERRRVTEEWLVSAAREALGRALTRRRCISFWEISLFSRMRLGRLRW